MMFWYFLFGVTAIADDLCTEGVQERGLFDKN